MPLYLHACKTVKNLYDTDRDFKKSFDAIDSILKIKV
jgi:hypothetical protein